MKKALLLAILGLILTTAIFPSMISPAKATINSRNWVGQYHYYDPYFGSYNVIVFPENSSATLMVEVYNNLAVPLNVSAVKVFLDWNINYSSTQCSVDNPSVIQPGFYRTFTITFTVPSTSIASNLVKHDYYMYVEHVNATTGPKQVSLHHSLYYTNDFVVYSTIQKDAQKLYDELDTLTTGTPTFESDEAEMLWNNGTREYAIGESSHKSGDFSNAKVRYETALELLYQALSTETSYQNTWESLDVLLKQAQIAQAQASAAYDEARATYQEAIANSSMKQADAAMIQANATMRLADAAMIEAEAVKTQAIAWIVFGIGFIVFGVAAVVWAYRRPIPPP